MKLNTFKILLFLFSLTLLPAHSAVRKEYKNLKSYIKTSNYSKGRELIRKCLSDTTINSDPYLYELAIALEQKANDDENMKLYLNQRYDTAAFFNTISAIFDYSLIQDSILRNGEYRSSAKKRYKRIENLKQNHPNLYSGGVYFIKKKNWSSADKLLSQYIDFCASPMFKGRTSTLEHRLPRAAFWSMTSNYEQKKFAEVFKYKDLAETDTANVNFILQYEAMSYQELRDTSAYVNTLYRGIQQTKQPEFFFSRLTDYYNSIRDYKSAYLLNDSLIRVEGNNTLYLYAQTIVLFNLKDYDKCIENTARVLSLNDSLVEANYYMGLCWYNKGLSLDEKLVPNPTSALYKEKKREVGEMFRKAMPYLEKFRAANPNDSDRWHAPLYRIYFSLNLSNKLKELEK